jgi:hypothetical protein
VEVKVHRLIRDEPVVPVAPVARGGAGLLLELAGEQRPGWRTDGAEKVDEYLAVGARGT